VSNDLWLSIRIINWYQSQIDTFLAISILIVMIKYFGVRSYELYT